MSYRSLFWLGVVTMVMVLIILITSARSAAWRCDIGEDSVLCQHGSTAQPSARVIHVQPSMDPDTLARVRRWEQACRPMPEVDRYGVARLRYARPGCEFGRTE